MSEQPSGVGSDGFEERLVRRLGVLQSRTGEGEPWTDAGEVGLGMDWDSEQVATAVHKYLRLLRLNYPDLDSRAVEREVVHRDKVVD